MGNLTKQYELIVSEGKRPFWMLLMAAICFTLVIYNLYNLAIAFFEPGFNEGQATILIPDTIQSVTTMMLSGIAFSITKTVLIDTDKDLLISRFCVGPFSKDVKSKVPQLEYVSVFLDPKERFQVNLWYIGNKHYKMYFFDEKESAMKFAELTALKLSIDLLDATEKGNSKWIDISKA
jgi:hypothetical protein